MTISEKKKLHSANKTVLEAGCLHPMTRIRNALQRETGQDAWPWRSSKRFHPGIFFAFRDIAFMLGGWGGRVGWGGERSKKKSHGAKFPEAS